MSKTHLFCAAIIGLMMCQIPAATFAASPSTPRAQAVSGCLAEANHPITQKSQYQNGSPRLREALKNAYHPGVSAAKAACRVTPATRG